MAEQPPEGIRITQDSDAGAGPKENLSAEEVRALHERRRKARATPARQDQGGKKASKPTHVPASETREDVTRKSQRTREGVRPARTSRSGAGEGGSSESDDPTVVATIETPDLAREKPSHVTPGEALLRREPSVLREEPKSVTVDPPPPREEFVSGDQDPSSPEVSTGSRLPRGLGAIIESVIHLGMMAYGCAPSPEGDPDGVATRGELLRFTEERLNAYISDNEPRIDPASTHEKAKQNAELATRKEAFANGVMGILGLFNFSIGCSRKGGRSVEPHRLSVSVDPAHARGQYLLTAEGASTQTDKKAALCDLDCFPFVLLDIEGSSKRAKGGVPR